MPITEIARQTGLRDQHIAKACDGAEVRPRAGYWQKVEHGKRVTRVALSNDRFAASDIITIDATRLGNRSHDRSVRRHFHLDRHPCASARVSVRNAARPLRSSIFASVCTTMVSRPCSVGCPSEWICGPTPSRMNDIGSSCVHQNGYGDPIRPALILLNLRKIDAENFPQFALAHTERLTSSAQTASDDDDVMADRK